MRAFRIGYILTLSFFLVLLVITLTLGYFSAPKGPKAPKYPSSSSYMDSSSSSYDRNEYSKMYEQYKKERQKYEKEQKTFIQDKVVPYVRNVFVGWVVLFLLFQVIGLVLAKFGSALVGAAYSFSGLWAILFGPLSGLVWFVGSIVSGMVTSFGSEAESEFTVRPIFQAVGLTSLVGVIVLTALGVLLFGHIKTMFGSPGPKEPATVIDPPITASEVSSPVAPSTFPPPESPAPGTPPTSSPSLTP